MVPKYTLGAGRYRVSQKRMIFLRRISKISADILEQELSY
jgi:hypothetical protein